MIRFAVICFLLPDGKIVLQRRDKHAKTASGMLGFFGGHIEKSERPIEAVKREITEETSINIDVLNIEFIGEYNIKADDDYPNDRCTYLFKSKLENLNFSVYEGDCAEAYFAKELLGRNDVAAGVRYMLKKIWKE